MERQPQANMSPAGIGRGKRQLPTGTPHPADVHVGSRLRLRRTALGMSQEHLGSAVGLTFQQIQKYERGANRIGSSRLYQFSHILDVPVGFFFHDMPIAAKHIPEKPGERPEATHPALMSDPMKRQETLDLVDAYYRIRDKTVRRRLYDLLRSMINLPDDV